MANSIYQGKINRQFWGKINRHFSKVTCLQNVTWGAFNPNISNKITFFHYDIRAG